MAGIHALPTEILHQILVTVEFVSRGSLPSCLVVSRFWYEVTTPILYRTVELDNGNSYSFLEQVTARYCPQIYSLTLHINVGLDDPTWPKDIENKPWATIVSLCVKLHKLKDKLPFMTSIAALSLDVDARGQSCETLARRVTVSKTIQLIEALPPSCVDLDVHIKGIIWDDADRTQEDKRLRDAICTFRARPTLASNRPPPSRQSQLSP
ncbi:hypothetical protein GQ53DRAFT_815619 [Thozetella sp. PMI_491]|nr:hypothetical protein GQ53DRAFT_815619 [Thozetella sp. PMI_491]